MGTKSNENGESLNKEQVIEKVKKLAENEKFKLDAFFLCGFPSGAPNQNLIKACEGYIETLDDAAANKDAAVKLVAELEAEMKATPDVAAKDNITSSADYVQLLLDNREVLLS